MKRLALHATQGNHAFSVSSCKRFQRRCYTIQTAPFDLYGTAKVFAGLRLHFVEGLVGYTLPVEVRVLSWAMVAAGEYRGQTKNTGDGPAGDDLAQRQSQDSAVTNVSHHIPNPAPSATEGIDSAAVRLRL